MYKHFIRLNDNKEVIKAFSSAFEQPEESDICINEDTMERHFNLSLLQDGAYKYKYDGKNLVVRTREEIDAVLQPQREKARILSRLAELDKVVPRSVEDLYSGSGIRPHESVQKVIDEKTSLRNDLKSRGQ